MRSLLLDPVSWFIVIVIVHRRNELRPGRKEKCDELMFVDIGVMYLGIDGASKLCVRRMLVYM